MLRCNAVFVLLVTLLSVAAWPVQAQSQRNGYSGYRRGTGYMSPYMGNAKPATHSVATTEEEAAESLPEDEQAVSTERSSKATRKTAHTIRSGQRSVLWTAFEDTSSIEVEPMPTDHGGDEEDGCLTCNQMGYCRPHCYWGRAEYLGWWKQGMRLPALVTTNPTTIPSLDNSGTTVLFGNESVNKDAKSGGRFTLGMWADPCQLHGLEFTYLHLGAETTSYYASGTDYAILGRPFFNIQTAAADADLINYSDPAHSGWVNVEAETKFQGTELLYRRAIKRSPCSQLDLLVGWRWLQLKDNLLISQSVTDSLSSTVDLSDRFNTKNNFHGVELGVQWQRSISCDWTLEILGKMALGNSRSALIIDGQQTGDPNQGLLALDSNSGTHTRNSLSAVTELGLSLKRRFNCGLEASFGYTFVYWGDVMRAGDQIDLNVDPRQIPPDPVSATHPAALMKTSDFWAQGLHFGLEYAF